MKRLLQKTCIVVAKRKCSEPTRPEYMNPRYPDSRRKRTSLYSRQAKWQRDRIAKTDAHNPWERMKRYEAAVLLFAKLPHVSFTNIRAERDLRMSKVKQKVSGCFRTNTCAEAYCRSSSYLQTMATEGYNPLATVQVTLSGQICAEGGE